MKRPSIDSLLIEGRFRLADGASLYLHNWQSEQVPRAVVLFSHGILEHAGRYADWGFFLARHGFDVIGVDARGHGRSDGPRGWCDSFASIIDDWEYLAVHCMRCYTDIPFFIAGMSMGGGIALQTAIRLQEHARKPQGLILVSPALRIGRWERLYLPGCLVDWFWPRILLKVGGTGSLSRDKNVRDDFVNDPLVNHDRIHLHYGVENLRAARRNRSLAKKLILPLLLQQGTGDRITPVCGAHEFVARTTARDKTLICYPDLYHDILHEPEKQQVFQDMLDWLNNRTARE